MFVFIFSWFVALSLTFSQTAYWNPNANLLAGSGEVQKAYHWTSNPDGSGAWPKSALDDNFDAATLGTAWSFADSTHDASGQPGTYSLANKPGKMVVSGRGADIWWVDNAFAGIYRKDIIGNFDVSVKVDTLAGSFVWSKAGILIYNDYQNIANGGGFAVIVTPERGIKIQYDSIAPAGNFEAPEGDGVAPLIPIFPCWLRAVKQAGTYWGYYKTSLNTPWILLGTCQPFNAASNAQVGLFVVSHKADSTSTVIFDDFQGGGDVEAKNLDLSFNGSSLTADADASLTGPFVAQTIDMAGYTGTFSFLNSSLTLSGNAKFGNTVNINAGTGQLILNGSSGTQLLSPKQGSIFPALTKSGAGTVQVIDNPIKAGVLTLSAGIFDLGGRNHEFEGLASTGGSLIGLGSADTLILTGDANFSGIASMSSVGSIQIKAQGEGKVVQLTPGSTQFPNLYLWPYPTQVNPAKIVIAPGLLVVRGNLILRDERVSAGLQGIVDFRTNNANVSVDGDIVDMPNGPLSGIKSLTLLMGNGNWYAKGNVSVFFNSGVPVLGSADASTLHILGTGSQTLSATGGALKHIIHSGTGSLLFGAELVATSLQQSAGTLDFNGFNFILSGNLSVTGGNATTFMGLSGRSLAVGGTTTLAGTAGNLLNLNPAGSWSLNSVGPLTADHAHIGLGAATGTAGQASATCLNAGGNTNWNFVPLTLPPLILREPADTAVLAGTSAVFATSASGTGPLTFQWLHKGDTTTLGKDSLFTLKTKSTLENAGLYYCIVSNAYGKDTTREATLALNEPALIVREPKDVSTGPGNKAFFSVSATGTGPFAFAWKISSDSNIVSTDSVYILDSAVMSQDGTLISVIVTNAFGKDSSRSALLSVKACDSLFEVLIDTVRVDEGQPASLTGKAVCHDGRQWSVVSGPAAKILDPDVNVLSFYAPRVVRDTFLVYRFEASFGKSTESRDIVVIVREAIPDPLFTLPATASWQGAKPLVLKPSLTNSAALKDSPYSLPLTYQWTLSSSMAEFSEDADSLLLFNPSEVGALTVELCMDNGGVKNCVPTKVEITGIPVAIGNRQRLFLGPVVLSGATLIWSASGSARIWDFQGRILWQGHGHQGQVLILPKAAIQALLRHRARLEILP